MNFFVFDGRNSRDWKVGLSGSGTYDAPARKGESVAIPGRNGAVWVDEGAYENTMLRYPCWIADGFDKRVDDFRAFLMAHGDKYYRLEDSYHPEEYRLARYPGEFVAEPGTRNLTGRFELYFDCDPRRWLKSGEYERELFVVESATEEGTTTTLYNPTHFPAAPIINFENAEPGSFYINDTRIVLNELVESANLDCETYVWTDTEGTVIAPNVDIYGDVRLQPGQNVIRETCSMVEFFICYITPRWWTI